MWEDIHSEFRIGEREVIEEVEGEQPSVILDVWRDGEEEDIEKTDESEKEIKLERRK